MANVANTDIQETGQILIINGSFTHPFVSQGQVILLNKIVKKTVIYLTKLQFMSVLRTDDIDPEMDRFLVLTAAAAVWRIDQCM